MATALLDNSTALAKWSNGESTGDLYYYAVTVHRHQNGKYFLRDSGGAAMRLAGVRWISEEQAKDFVRRCASHWVSGYGYTDEETEAIFAGENPRGSREGGCERPDMYDY